jgi:protoporphyrinogen oxidase
VIKVWQDDLEGKGVPILTNKKVTKIIWQNPDGKVIIQTENGEVFDADHVIVTVSLGTVRFMDMSKFCK